MGYYEIVVETDEKAALDENPVLVQQRFRQAMHESLVRWMSLAAERLPPEFPAFMMLGNDDYPEYADVLRSTPPIRYAEGEVLELPGDLQLLSFGYSNPTPWASPRELPESEIAQHLERLFGRAQPQRAVFNCHCPPYDTHLDKAPALDKELRPLLGVGTLSVGSTSVRSAIEVYQPLVGLHGHVHDCAAADRLGRTLCLNPGSDYGIGSLRGAIVEVEGRKVERYQLTIG
jgi:Icc-related predicted phosphoesterase